MLYQSLCYTVNKFSTLSTKKEPTVVVYGAQHQNRTLNRTYSSVVRAPARYTGRPGFDSPYVCTQRFTLLNRCSSNSTDDEFSEGYMDSRAVDVRSYNRPT